MCDRAPAADHAVRARSRPTSSNGASRPRAVPVASTRTRRTRKVEVRFDIEASPSLGPRQRARLSSASARGCGSSRRSAVAAPEPRARDRAAAASGSPPRCTSTRRVSRPSRRGPSKRAPRRREAPARRAQAGSRRRPSGDDVACAMHVVANVALIVAGRRRGRSSCSTPRCAPSSLPRGAPVLFTSHRVPRGAAIAVALRRARRRSYECARPRHGAVRAARAAHVPAPSRSS